MNQTAASTPTFGQRMRRWLRRLLLILGILLVIFMLFAYYGSYSKGVRAGIVVKVSESGVVFKTWEGQLNLQTFGASKGGTNQLSEVFEFSVESSNDSVIHELEQASLTGERVNLHYVERYVRLPWRGSTTYFITEVERSGQVTSPGRTPVGH